MMRTFSYKIGKGELGSYAVQAIAGFGLALCCLLTSATATAAEHTILLGPKTIGAGWKDNIVLEARHFQQSQVGDILTVYTDNAKRSAQGAFQNPQDWQAIAPEYAYFGVNGPFRLVMTDAILARIKARGLAISGHDYRILRATLTPGSEFQETMVWKGPSVLMKSDWSVSAEVPAKCLSTLAVGDGLRLHVSKVETGAAVKLMDFTWNALDATTDGAPLGGDSYTYYVTDDAPLIKIRLAGSGDNVALRIGGKSYRLDKIGIVKFTGQRDESLADAQRAPKEYVLGPGELFHGEKTFPNDWSGNLRLTAEPFQDCTENDVVIVSYTLLPGLAAAGVQPKMSFRENKGKWLDLSGAKEPVWQNLDGNDVVLTFDAGSLDKVKTSGLVVTGLGFTLTKITLMKVE